MRPRNADTGHLRNHLVQLTLTLVLVCAAALPALANEPVGSRSVLEVNPDHSRDHLTQLPDSQRAVDIGDRCAQLQQQADALKGRPQQRSAAMARLDAECRNP